MEKVVFELNANSACGLDGFYRELYQVDLDIIGKDVTELVNAFFCGRVFPKFITHTTLVLMPKKELVGTFMDLRPISLSSFINKILSRVIHDRVVVVLPQIISLD